jgi:uncharacterized protein (TIGR01777 family)
MRVLITGGTGMLGVALASNLVRDGHEVIVPSRSPAKKSPGLPAQVQLTPWDGKTTNGWSTFVDGADAIVNLAGERLAGPNPIVFRWTEERKRRIKESRLHAGQALLQAIQVASVKPNVLIQASGVDYYAPSNTHATEESPPGDDFLSDVCANFWEPSTKQVEAQGVRRAVIRMGPILNAQDGALPPLVLQTKLFLGGPIGSGKQWFSWIHIADVVAAIRTLITNSDASGVYNLTAPNPLTNADFSRVLGHVLGRPSFLPLPGFAMKIMFGEMAQTLLQGPRAIPQHLQELGFEFQFPKAEAALRDLLQ